MKAENKGFLAVVVQRGKRGFISTNSEPMAKKPVAVRLPQSMDEKVRRLAADRGIGVGEWIREAIAAHLNENSDKDEKEVR